MSKFTKLDTLNMFSLLYINYCSIKLFLKTYWRIKRQAIVSEKIFQIMYLIKDLYPEYLKNSQKFRNKKTTQLRNG